MEQIFTEEGLSKFAANITSAFDSQKDVITEQLIDIFESKLESLDLRESLLDGCFEDDMTKVASDTLQRFEEIYQETVS